MLLRQLRYVVETNRTGSISQAAQNLFMTQPNLSTAITELEEELGVKLFTRTSRGVEVTDDGLQFIQYAEKILNQMSELEGIYQKKRKDTSTLRFAWSQTAFSSHIVAKFIQELPADASVNIQLFETSHLEAINAVRQRDADVGKIVIPESNLEAFKRYAIANGLTMEVLWYCIPGIIVSKKSKLASEKVIHSHMLTDEYIQLVYRLVGIHDIPNAPASKKREISLCRKKNIFYNDRGLLMDVLISCPNTFICGMSVHPDFLKTYGLVKRPHTLTKNRFLEVVLYQKRNMSDDLKRLLGYIKDMRETDPTSME